MNLDQVTLQLLLIFFPGVLCAYLVDTFTSHPKASQFRFVLNTFLFGVASYFLYTLALTLCGVSLSEFRYIALLSGTEVDECLIYEIAAVCGVAVLLGLAAVGISTYRLHYRILKALRLTKRAGDEDLWSHMFNLPGVSWVVVRDLRNNLAYHGYVQGFSYRYAEAELLLRDVTVYQNDTGIFMHNAHLQYLSLESDCIAIEIRSPSDPAKEP